MEPALYRFGNQTVRSVLAMPALQSATTRNLNNIIQVDWCDCTIAPDIVWNHHWRDGEQIALSLARHGPDYWLRVPGIADVLLQLEPACRVLVSTRSTSSDASTLEHLLIDQILPRLLAQRGELMVHASALQINGHHALFLAPSGWGKSTLAGLLQHRGHTVLSDDCVQLELANGQLSALPTYPSLRLNPDSLDALFPDLADTAPVAGYSLKRRVDLTSQLRADTAVPVDALYLLGDPAEASDAISILPLRPAKLCTALITRSFRLDLADRAATTAQLERCSDIARCTPAFRLDYRRDFARHGELANALCTHLNGLKAAC